MDNGRHSFGGSFGFIMAAAASAVGLGNIWRFPYLAARDGGGLFLIVYIILALTFGFALVTTEIAIGRKTKQSSLTAYNQLREKWKPLGILSCLVPMIIVPYYCAIGGWVFKYFLVFAGGHGVDAAEDGFFGGFITAETEPMVLMFIFSAACLFIILKGVNAGIERSAKILMPVLIVLVMAIGVFCLFLSHTDADGTVRTGVQGLGVYMIPSFEGVTVSKFLSIVMDAVGQLFYSLSVAMGILIAYGSYARDDSNLVTSINMIEIFDTLVAFLAGVMIIPAVYIFIGREGMSASGPSLMFVMLPKVFASMGPAGNVVGTLFFAMVLFAALTSAVSLFEAIVSSFMDQFHMDRKKATITEGVISLVVGAIVCLGYNILYFELPLPGGAVGQVLDLLDYVSNSIMMPIVALLTCILVGWIIKPEVIIDEVTKNGESFKRKGLYVVMVKYVAPIFLIILLLKALGLLG